MYEEIVYEVEDPIATITLNRPDKLNAMSASLLDELEAALIHRRHHVKRIRRRHAGISQRARQP